MLSIRINYKLKTPQKGRLKNENFCSMVISLPSCAFENFFVTYWCIFRFEAENKKTELN